MDPGPGRQTAVAGTLLQEPWEFSSEQLAAGVPLELAGRVVVLLHLADPSAHDSAEGLGMVGTSVGIQRVRRLIEQVADLDVPVLVRGETGSGKELIARALHERSPRRGKPFISVNLGAIPKELAAAELFGARKGAFTGATRDQEGFFQAAHGGTLFLDEVGEASPEVQVMLLRVLETGEVFPVGERTPVKVDLRLVAATDAALEQQIQEGRFKAPLLHRLAGFSIRVPPLRERREDIGLLFHHFARKELESLGETRRLEPEDALAEPWLPSALAVRLLRHDWPGNIRQLRNVVRQLVIGSRGQARLQLDAQLEQELAIVKPSALGGPISAPPSPAPRTAPRRKPSEIPETELIATLRACGWDFQAAADRLGVHRTSIYDLIQRSPSLRTAGELSVEESPAATRSAREIWTPWCASSRCPSGPWAAASRSWGSSPSRNEHEPEKKGRGCVEDPWERGVESLEAAEPGGAGLVGDGLQDHGTFGALEEALRVRCGDPAAPRVPHLHPELRRLHAQGAAPQRPAPRSRSCRLATVRSP